MPAPQPYEVLVGPEDLMAMFADSLERRAELGPNRILVNAVMPGWVLTDRQMALWATPEDLAAHLARQCLPEHLKEEDLVEPVLFLASDTARMMTGQALVIDGGVVVTG